MTDDNGSRIEECLDRWRHSLIYGEDFSPADWYFSPDNAQHCWGLLSKSIGRKDYHIGFVPLGKDMDGQAILSSLAEEMFARYDRSSTPTHLLLVAVLEDEPEERLISLASHKARGRHAVDTIAIDVSTGRIASPQEFRPTQPGAKSIGFLPDEVVVRVPAIGNMDERREQERARRWFRQRARRSLLERSRGTGWGKPLFTTIIIALNVLVFLVEELAGGSTSSRTLVLMGAKVSRLVEMGQWWRVFTYQFLHIGVMHLLVNSYSLYSLGPFIEDVYGRWQFLIIYLLSGTMGGVASSALSPQSISAGASGAIFGLLGATAFYLVSGQTSWDIIWRTVGYPIIVTTGYGLLLRIDHFAHFGGLVGGFLLAAAMGLGYRTQPWVRIGGALTFLALLVLLAALI